MKKPILLLTFLFSFTLSYGQKVFFGPEIGMNIILIENTDIGYNFHLGYHFGGHLKYHFSKKFKLSTGIFISQKKKGYNSSVTSSALASFTSLLNFGGVAGMDTAGLDSMLNIPGLNTNMTETTNGISSELFIEIPVLANYSINHFNLYLGPYIGILISASKKEEIITDVPMLDVINMETIDPSGLSSLFLPSSGTKVTTISGTDGFNSLDFGINVGIGYEINNLNFNLMYSYGLIDYRKDKLDEPTETLKLMRISIAYLFELKKKDTENSARFE